MKTKRTTQPRRSTRNPNTLDGEPVTISEHAYSIAAFIYRAEHGGDDSGDGADRLFVRERSTIERFLRDGDYGDLAVWAWKRGRRSR